MTVFTLTQGARGTGFAILTWRSQRAVANVDSPGTFRYLEVYGQRFNVSPNTTPGGRSIFIVPFTGTLKNFLIKFDVTPPVGTLFEFLVSNSDLSSTVVVASLTASDTNFQIDNLTSHSVSQGQVVQVRVSYATGTPTNTATFPQAIVTLS